MTTLTTLTFNVAQSSSTMTYNGYSFTATDGTLLVYTNNDGMTQINGGAFQGNTEIVSAIFPTTVTTMHQI